jgi:decaprenyl-phosphate phosphoribosyltransferase
MVYGLWVITVPRESTTATLISLVPFTLGLLVYALVIDNGKGGEPETAILRNLTLLVLSALWAVSLVAVLYL